MQSAKSCGRGCCTASGTYEIYQQSSVRSGQRQVSPSALLAVLGMRVAERHMAAGMLAGMAAGTTVEAGVQTARLVAVGTAGKAVGKSNG